MEPANSSGNSSGSSSYNFSDNVYLMGDLVEGSSDLNSPIYRLLQTEILNTQQDQADC